ncbi:hypothetical protein B7P43_G09907 [Cryptotermes secundus]|uniref:C2 domain-containing protein n=2 Tax=Cryptotermes secundus TaxID=105785 RepID=A0A2J7RDH8_9NEOP|nr:hypothetical protein B7P43_G09907 [Cryptotermes secundus]
MPSNAPVKLSVRVYVVRAFGLCSRDLNGKSDPYLMIKLGSRSISDKVNYFPRQLDPTFGRCFELEAILPRDNTLTVCVMDFDIAGLDDIVGETSINLENRYYSRHRATCGLASSYEVAGYNRWRDVSKPSHILQNLCRKCNISGPKYIGGHIVLGDCDEVKLQELRENSRESEDEGLNQEELALYALRRWHKVCRGGYRLVPEHVETRSLFHPKKPGIEQGKLEMWVDMFPMGEVPLPPPVDITPPPPQEYELRVIIWNTEDVILQDDSFLIGEKMSDIFVKGWLVGDDVQTTDVHYRSLTGEGNFNWRFIFRFNYHAPENKIIIVKKDSLFLRKLTEHKIPCRLHLQIWDNDFIRNDLLGSLTFDLAKMPRGARSCRSCGLNIVSKHAPRISLFKMSRFKGWWPFQNVPPDGLQPKLTGKLEAEFTLLTKEEAERKPAGFGRNGPDPLSLPKRPETSFLWLMNPVRSFKHIILPHFKGVFLISVISIIIFVGLFLLIRYLINKFTI